MDKNQYLALLYEDIRLIDELLAIYREGNEHVEVDKVNELKARRVEINQQINQIEEA